jgi:hypothetical protein
MLPQAVAIVSKAVAVDGPTWALLYQQQEGLPDEHALGLRKDPVAAELPAQAGWE